jgi:hypothetical protein
MKAHGNCTPCAQWDQRRHTTGRATQAFDPHQASRLGFAKGKLTIALALPRRVMTPVVKFVKEAELGSVLDERNDDDLQLHRLPIYERCSIASGRHDAVRYVRASVRRTDGIPEDSRERNGGFCSRCGTAIYSTSVGDDPKVYNVRVGALRQRNELVPRRQLFVRSQQSWINDLNSIQKFDKMPTP